MKQIAIFADNLNVGGIQKSIINMLKQIDYNKFIIDLYLFEKTTFYEIPPKVNVIFLKKPSKIHKFILFSIERKILKIDILPKEYDVAIDFDSYQMHTAIGTLSCKAKKKVIWIHNDIPIKLREEPKYRILHFFFKGKYRYFDTFCAVSKGALDSFKTLYYDINKDYRIIPNYINTEEINIKAEQPCELQIDRKKINIVNVGRLCHQKGIDILIEYVNKLKIYRKDFHLYLIGDGPDRKILEKKVKELKLEDYITFLGNQKNPFKFLKLMDIFCFTSRYEGQGMVLLEAKAIGLQIVMPKSLEKYCPGIEGTDDIIKELRNAKKKKLNRDELKKYNEEITNELEKMFNS